MHWLRVPPTTNVSLSASERQSGVVLSCRKLAGVAGDAGCVCITWGARRGSQILTRGLHLWRFRFAGFTTYHGSSRRLVRR